MKIPEEVLTLAKKSGNNFHLKVARWFIADGWHVSISPYYMDQNLSKAREIDLVVEKVCCNITNYSDGVIGKVVVRLFVECKFVPSSSVFWFFKKDRDQAMDLVCTSGPFEKDNSYTKKHRYLTDCPKVAKLFASSKDKLNENEPFYKALNQSLNAMVSMRELPVSIPEFKTRPYRGVEVLLQFPVVVCSSFKDIYGVDFLADSIPTKVTGNFQLEVTYAYFDQSSKQMSEYFLLDFVEFDKLTEFSEAVKGDADLAAFFISET